MLKVSDRVKQNKLNHIYKIWNDTCPVYLKEHFHRICDTELRNCTRASFHNFLYSEFTDKLVILFSTQELKTGTFYLQTLSKLNLSICLKKDLNKIYFQKQETLNPTLSYSIDLLEFQFIIIQKNPVLCLISNALELNSCSFKCNFIYTHQLDFRLKSQYNV